MKAISHVYWPSSANKALREDGKSYVGFVHPGTMTLEHGLSWVYWWDGTNVHYEEETK
jgi:hypothetical protein